MSRWRPFLRLHRNQAEPSILDDHVEDLTETGRVAALENSPASLSQLSVEDASSCSQTKVDTSSQGNPPWTTTSPSADDKPWGLKVLHPGVDPTVDFVAVHGLNGERERTWTAESNNVLWLRDLLPQKIKNARILTWGYDARTHTKSHTDFLSTKKLYDHGRELVYDLWSERRETETSQRPIIFIAHSLGGIIVKDALLHSDRARTGHLEEQRSIKLSTYGIIFMGTPHQGGQGVSMATVLLNVCKLQGHTSDKLLKHLEEHSELLQRQMADFTAIGQDFDIVFAYETLPTQIKGAIAKEIVPKWSAVVPGTPDAAEFGIAKDHRCMTKFARAEDQGYKDMSRALFHMSQSAASRVKRNWFKEEQSKLVNAGETTYAVPFSTRGVPIVSKYVLRAMEMKQMAQVLRPEPHNTSRRTVVLHGLGGSGKTQLAIEFARKHAEDFTARFWLNAQTEETVRQSIVNVAKQLPPEQISEKAMKGHQKTVEEVDETIQEVLKWFGKPKNSRWLIIYDNVDRESTVNPLELGAYSLEQYLPPWDCGSVIITTTLSQLQRQGQGIKISSMTREEGLQLLGQHLGVSVADNALAHKTIELLGGLPLAIAQSGSFMRETGTSICDYITQYDSTWNRLMKVEAAYPLREYGDRSVLTTWTISFEQIQRENNAAARMLQLWSYLNNRDIWFGLFNSEENIDLNQWSSPPEWFRSVIDSKHNFREAARILLAYNMIEADQDSGSYVVHPVLHRAVHNWCLTTLPQGAREELAWLAITTVGFAVPPTTRRNYWTTQLRLLPHANRNFGDTTYGLRTSTEDGQDVQVLDLSHAVNNLGNLYTDQGKMAEAEAMFQRALAGYEKALGSDHTSTLGTVNNLGLLYTDQGKMAEAEAMFQRALAGYKKALGPDHTSTLTTVNNLGVLYRNQGKMAEAEAMFQRALAGYEKALGPDHTSTLGTVNNLGVLYRNQGKMAEAEAMFQRALAGYEKALGPDHTSTLGTVNNLGLLYADQGKMAEAEAMYQRALAGYEKALGSDHTSTLRTVKNLGNLYRSQGKMAKAEAMYQRALAGYEKALGPDHKSTRDVIHNLEICHRKLVKEVPTS